ncbi:hypothetical protein FO519_007108 [Halicephalobus sp. NKZ332]|nr:hypothetical protein FO519_007108 [Halicephalobus sp. NKZ332]
MHRRLFLFIIHRHGTLFCSCVVLRDDAGVGCDVVSDALLDLGDSETEFELGVGRGFERTGLEMEETTLDPPPGYLRVPENFTEGMPELIVYHRVNTVLGGICTLIAGFNFFIFIGSSKFRKLYKMLTALALADMLNTIAMMTMGFNRQSLYSEIIETLMIPIRDSWQCAIEPWIWLKIIGEFRTRVPC